MMAVTSPGLNIPETLSSNFFWTYLVLQGNEVFSLSSISME